MGQQNFIRDNQSSGVKNYFRGVGRIFLVALKLIPYFIFTAAVLCLIILVFLGATLLPHYNTLKSVYEFSIDGQTHLLSAENFISEQKFKSSGIELVQAEQSFHSASENLKSLENAMAFKIGFLRDQFIVAQDLVFIGENLSGSLQDVSNLGQEFLDTLKMDNLNFLQITEEKKMAALEKLASSADRLEKVQLSLLKVQEKLVDIDKHQPLFFFQKAVEPLQEQIPKLQKAVEGVTVAAKLLPAFSGYPKEKTYLFIFQNNREMRPSGGFIGSYGIVKLKNAELKTFFTDNSYNLDQPAEAYLNIPSPEPMKKYLNQPKWFFRDSNWWPDFPMSAEKMSWFYKMEGGKENLDGVIAITPTVLEELLGIIGEFKIDDLVFNKNNFWEQLEYEVEYGYYKKGIATANRKDIIGELGKQIIARLYLLPSNKYLELVDLFKKEMQEKQILLYFKDSSIQSVALKNNWAGEVKNFTGDYLMLVDANLAALKTDSAMRRTMSYRLVQDKKDHLIAETKVTYENLGTFSWKTTRYRTYTRLYVPLGSELISVKVGDREIKREDIDITTEFSKTVFGQFFEVEPQKFQTVTWQYSLPAKVQDKIAKGEYSLLIQKQPGIEKMNLQLDISFNREIQDKQRFSFTSGKNAVKHVDVIRGDRVFTTLLK
jgi:hypothetical protein